MRLFLAIFMGLLVMVSPAAGAVDDIVEVLQTGVRCDAYWSLYLTVTGKTKSGQIRYIEEKIENEKFDIVTNYDENHDTDRYEMSCFKITYDVKDEFYAIGEIQDIYYINSTKPMVQNCMFTVPWSFDINTQKFKFDFKVDELIPMRLVDGKPDPNGKMEILNELKAKALQGDEGAIATLKDRGAWN